MRDSSLDAYQSILDKLSAKRKMIFNVISKNFYPICDKQIAHRLNWDINRVTGRRGELEKMGLIESVGRKKSPYSKIPVHHWKVSDPEKAIAESKRVKEKPKSVMNTPQLDDIVNNLKRLKCLDQITEEGKKTLKELLKVQEVVKEKLMTFTKEDMQQHKEIFDSVLDFTEGLPMCSEDYFRDTLWDRYLEWIKESKK